MKIRLQIFIALLTVGLLFLVGCSDNEAEGKEASFYVANAGEGTISVIDPTTYEETDKIDIDSDQASHGIAATLDGDVVYSGTGFNGKTLLKIDTDTKETLNEIVFDKGVHGIDISPDEQQLYVSLNAGLGEDGGSVAIVDTDTFTVTEEVQTGSGPAHVAVTSSGDQVWVANVNDDSVSVIETDSHSVQTIEVGKVPNEVAITPDEKYVFVANVESNVVSVIDTNSLETVQTVKAGDGPHGVTVSLNGEELWVANNDSNDVHVIDTATLETKAIIPTGSYTNHVAFSLDGEQVYVTNRSSNDLVSIDREKKEIKEKISIGEEPHEISLEDFVAEGNTEINYQFANENSVVNNDSKVNTVSQTVESVDVEATHITNVDEVEGVQLDLSEYLAFQISLTTHSGDLSQLGLEDSIYLVDGSEKIEPEQWTVLSEDAHHPSYIAIFPNVDGNYVLQLEEFFDQTVVLDFFE
ncbi:YncE family protein [Aquibacillus sediminis]|uniref:YncE family protein n=1 Tax=Aquibacillus sediminis TaxID=2574734 RepID=UPI001486F1FE|nr:YncE family protein [Aquibacillus sediminis]